MIPYHVYKVLHLTSVFMVIMSLGAMTLHAANGGGKQHPFRKLIVYTHGIGLLLALIAGFGLLARLGFAHNAWPPGWAMMKICIWFIFGALSGVLVRKPKFAKQMWFCIIVLFAGAAYFANYKPF